MIAKQKALIMTEPDTADATKAIIEDLEFLKEAEQDQQMKDLVQLARRVDLKTLPFLQPWPQLQTTNYLRQTFPWSDRLLQVATDKWKIASFNPAQEPVLNAMLDNRDIIVSMPTGGGKSLCFQLPHLLLGDVLVIVVSPLKALSRDQVLSAKARGIAAEALDSDTGKGEVGVILQRMQGIGPPLHLLYVTPERFRNDDFCEVVTIVHDQGRLNRFVIDEGERRLPNCWP